MKTILVCGSKHLTGDVDVKREIARDLGREIVKVPTFRLLTGGSTGDGDGETTGGVDFMAAIGAQEELDPDLLPDKLLTVVPKKSSLNSLFRAGAVVHARAKTTPTRRFELASRADAVVTVEGNERTPRIIEYAIAAETPVIPIACTGGASELVWAEGTNRQVLLTTLGLADGDTALEVLQHGLDTPSLVVEMCMSILTTALRPRCFVIRPFGSEHSDALCHKVLSKVLQEKGCELLQADRLHETRPTMDAIGAQIDQADLFIADLTGSDPNVLYELGLAHAKNKPVLMIYRKERDERLERLIPFDLREFRVLPYSPSKPDEFEKGLKLWIADRRQPRP
jgi:hypothetical protein